MLVVCQYVPTVEMVHYWGQLRPVYYLEDGMNIIHLLNAGEGNVKIYSPKSTIWYSWMNKCSYFLNPHAINVLLYRIKPRKHIHVTYCWQTYFKSIATLSQTFKNHIHNKWCVPSASDVFLSKNDNSGGKTREASEGGGIWFLFHGIWFLSCVITCSDFYPLSKQINLFMVINIWGIII
jgi:hypothetical protein